MSGFNNKKIGKLFISLCIVLILYRMTLGYTPPGLYVLSCGSKYRAENLDFHSYFSEAHGLPAYSSGYIPEIPYEGGCISIKASGVIRECAIYAWDAGKDAEGNLINNNPVKISYDNGAFFPIEQENYNIYEISITYLSGTTATYGFKMEKR